MIDEDFNNLAKRVAKLEGAVARLDLEIKVKQFKADMDEGNGFMGCLGDLEEKLNEKIDNIEEVVYERTGKEIAYMTKISKWISVKDYLPGTYSEWVIVRCVDERYDEGTDFYSTAIYSPEKWKWILPAELKEYEETAKITHWCYRPDFLE